MLNLDIRSLSFIAMIGSLLLALGLQLVNRVVTNDASMRLWARGATVNGLGFVLLALRGVVPDAFSIVLGNTLLAAGIAWMYLGNRRFCNLADGPYWHWVLVSVVAASSAYFTYVEPSLAGRIVTLSLVAAIILSAAAVVLLRPGDKQDVLTRGFVAAPIVATALLMLVRVVLTLRVSPQSQDFMALKTGIDAFALVFAIALNALHGIGLPLLVLGRLYRQQALLEKNVAERTQALEQANDDLATREALVSQILDTSSVGIFLVDRSGCITKANQRMAEMFRCPLQELEGKEYVDLVHPDERETGRQKMLALLQSSIAAVDLDRQYWRSDHTQFWGHLAGKRFHDAKGHESGLIGVISDITDLKRNELVLAEARVVAESASRAKSAFLANMSHEIRTPMNAILGLLSLLQSTELSTRQRDYASKTTVAAQSLLGLLNDILDFSKVEAGKMRLESLPIRLDELLRNLSVILSASVGSKNMEVLFDIAPDVPEVVCGDALRLQQVLINLGGNAVKFTAQGQVVIGIRQVASAAGSARIAFSVQDTGIGIAPENQAEIFIGFAQAEASTTRKFGGTGLGLTISKRLIELMGGELRLSSSPGVGSTFSFVLDMPLEATEPVASPAAPGTAVPQHSLLVVDDNAIAAQLMLRMAQAWGWAAEWAHSGARALQLVQARQQAEPGVFPYSVVCVDWKLPDMDGWEAMRQLRLLAAPASSPAPVMLMLGTNGRESLAHRSQLEQGLLDGFLMKPLTGPMLLEAVLSAGSSSKGLRDAATPRNHGRQLVGMRVLVVEDNLLNQQVAEELLSEQGAIVSLAANGQLGVDAVRAAAPQFDVVLMDLQMPLLDGYAATSIIRNELGLTQLPIVAMTANAMSSDRDACLAAGMNEHVGKPFDMGRLVSLLIRITGFAVHPGDAQQVATERSPLQLEIPGLDLHTALARMSGMQSLYLRTAQDFIGILTTCIPDIRAQLDQADMAKVLMQLHTLRGNAGTLGAMALAREVAKVEALCKSDSGAGQRRHALEELDRVAAEARSLLQAAVQGLKAHAAAAPPPPVVPAAPAAAVLAALQSLHALLATSDMDALLRFAELRDVLSALPEPLCEQLDLALQDLDFDQAHGLCLAAMAALEQP